MTQTDLTKHKPRIANSQTAVNLPPQDIAAEEAVLGAMLLEKQAVTHVLSIIPVSRAFYLESHQVVFEAIKTISEKGMPIDIITVTSELRSTGELQTAGGAHGVTLLSTKVNSAVHIEQHCRIILEEFMKRVIITVSSDNIRYAYDPTTDGLDILNKAQAELIKIQEILQTRQAMKGKELFNLTLKAITEAKENESGITGITSGFKSIDKITAGWQKSDLIIIAARPGMGKTTFCLKVARNAVVVAKADVAIFSQEMSKQQLMTKLIASETKISSAALRKGDIEEYQWATLHQKCGTTIFSDQFHIDDSCVYMEDIRTKSIILKAKYDIKMVVVDYLQRVKMRVKTGNREQEISAISDALKSLAKELDIPVIALSQLSRQVEQRPNKRPMLSDLRESGSIEQDADMVIFLYRPEYYKIEVDEDGKSTKDICDVIFEKHRNGALGTETIGCDMKYSDMFDLPDSFDQLPAKEYNPNKFTESSKDEEEPF